MVKKTPARKATKRVKKFDYGKAFDRMVDLVSAAAPIIVAVIMVKMSNE